MKFAFRKMSAALARWARACFDTLGATFDMRDVLLAGGLALLAAGLARVYVPAAFILPGAVLVYVALFHRAPATPPEAD